MYISKYSSEERMLGKRKPLQIFKSNEESLKASFKGFKNEENAIPV